jgi:hypothetical protein
VVLLNADPKYHTFSCLNDSHDSSRPTRGFTERDGIAMKTRISMLVEEGYRPGQHLINHPGPRERDADGDPVFPDPNQPHKVPLVAAPGDVVTTVTRLVTHWDIERYERRGSWPAGTDLEAILADAWRAYFDLLTRTTAALKPELHGLFAPGFENRRHVTFRQVASADSEDVNEAEASLYRTLGHKKYDGPPRTAAFALRLPELWKGGPGYVGSFAMTGDATLAWTQILRTRMTHLLREDGFVMVELTPDVIPTRATSVDFAEGWDARVILHHRL